MRRRRRWRATAAVAMGPARPGSAYRFPRARRRTTPTTLRVSPGPTSRAAAGTTEGPVDVVLVGLPGSGKSVVGRRLASRHGATFLDLDESIERSTGRTIPEIFESDGE